MVNKVLCDNSMRCREQVSAGYSTTEYGCLEFRTRSSKSPSDDDTKLIVGLAVGLGLLVIIVVIVIIICVVRSRRRRKHTDTTMSYRNRQAEGSHYADVATTARTATAEAQGTTRSSFLFGTELLPNKPVESLNVTQY